MRDPFEWLPSSYRWMLLAFLFIGTVVLFTKLATQSKPLKTSAAPAGIASYQFAWERARADRIRDSWIVVNHKGTARQQILLDFGFLIVYPLFFSLACAMLGGSPLNSMAPAGIFLSWAILAAVPLDAVENLALLRMLEQGASGFLARLAGLCAGVKFVLVYSGLGYLLLQGTAVLVERIRTA